MCYTVDVKGKERELLLPHSKVSLYVASYPTCSVSQDSGPQTCFNFLAVHLHMQVIEEYWELSKEEKGVKTHVQDMYAHLATGFTRRIREYCDDKGKEI